MLFFSLRSLAPSAPSHTTPHERRFLWRPLPTLPARGQGGLPTCLPFGVSRDVLCLCSASCPGAPRDCELGHGDLPPDALPFQRELSPPGSQHPSFVQGDSIYALPDRDVGLVRGCVRGPYHGALFSARPTARLRLSRPA